MELLLHNAEVDYTERGDRATPLYIASQNGRTLVAKALILKDASPDLADNDGFTPVHIAATNSHKDVIREFLLRNVDLNIQMKTKQGFTPLMLAKSARNDTVIRFLQIFC